MAALLRAADVAMYSAKADGRGRMRMFEPVLDAKGKRVVSPAVAAADQSGG